MSSSKIIVILGVIWFSYAAAVFTTLLNKQEHFESGQFKFALVKHMPMDRNFFAYGICKTNESSNSTECNVSRETLNGKNNGSSCRVSLKGITSKYSLALRDFDDDKVMIYWYNERDELPNYYIRFTIVRFSNCSTNEAKIKYNLRALRDMNFVRSSGAILLKGETFTVAFDNSGLFGSKIDERTFDSRGNVIRNVISWFKPLSKQSTMFIDNYKNDNHALLELDVDNRQSRFSLINDNGLKVLNVSTFKSITTAHYDVSTLYNTLRLCRLVEPSSKIDCDAFNESGELIGNAVLEFNHKPVQLTVYNAIDTSFFIITTSVLSETSEQLFYISKFNADGKHNATMELPGYRCKGNKARLIPYENEKDLHCVMRICTSESLNDEFINTNTMGAFEVVVKCFSSEDVK